VNRGTFVICDTQNTPNWINAGLFTRMHCGWAFDARMVLTGHILLPPPSLNFPTAKTLPNVYSSVTTSALGLWGFIFAVGSVASLQNESRGPRCPLCYKEKKTKHLAEVVASCSVTWRWKQEKTMLQLGTPPFVQESIASINCISHQHWLYLRFCDWRCHAGYVSGSGSYLSITVSPP